MALGIDDSTITLTTDDGSHFFHLRCNIHLTDSCGVVFAAMALRDITQGTRRTQVAHRRTLDMVEDVVSHRHQRVFLAIHLAVLLDEGQTVYIRVYDDAEVIATTSNLAHDAAEVALQRLRIMCEIAVSLTIEELIFHSECIEQMRQDNATDRVDRVDAHLEVSLLDSIHIHEVESQHAVDMTLVEAVVVGIVSEMIYICVFKILLLCNVQHGIAVGLGQELALVVEQLQRIPMAWIVAGRDDDAAIGATHAYGEFSSRRCCQADVKHIVAHTHQRAADNAAHHRTGDAGVTPHDNLVGRRLCTATDERSVSRSELHNVQGIQCISCAAANRTANAGNRFNQSHILIIIYDLLLSVIAHAGR